MFNTTTTNNKYINIYFTLCTHTLSSSSSRFINDLFKIIWSWHPTLKIKEIVKQKLLKKLILLENCNVEDVCLIYWVLLYKQKKN